MQGLSLNYGSSGGSLVIYNGDSQVPRKGPTIFSKILMICPESYPMIGSWKDKSLPPAQIFNGRQYKIFFSLIIKRACSGHTVLLHRIIEILIHTHSTEPSRLRLLSRLSWRYVTLQGKDEVIIKALKCSKYRLLLFSEICFRSNQLKPKSKSLSYWERCFLEHLFSTTSGKKYFKMRETF